MLNKAMFSGLVRHLLTMAGGYLVAKGYIGAENVDTVVGAVISIIGAGWSVKSKQA